MSRRSLILVRHAKSDWSQDLPDHDRPLAPRGRRQAPEAGRWIAANLEALDAALVSSAVRACSTWDLVAAELEDPPVPSVDELLYTSGSGPLLARVRALPASVRTAALVGHNPAMEELLERLVGEHRVMRTSTVAVVSWAGEWTDAGLVEARLDAHGRPPG